MNGDARQLYQLPGEPSRLLASGLHLFKRAPPLPHRSRPLHQPARHRGSTHPMVLPRLRDTCLRGDSQNPLERFEEGTVS